MEKQENKSTLPTDVSVVFSDGISVQEGLCFKTLLERFYLMNDTASDDLIFKENTSGFVKPGLDRI